MIEGVVIQPLRQICDERGKVMHMLRADSELFQGFGEIYFSVVNHGVIKAWHLHRQMTLNYAVVFGMIKLVLYDDRDNSPTRGELLEFFLGPENYQAGSNTGHGVERIQGNLSATCHSGQLRDRAPVAG